VKCFQDVPFKTRGEYRGVEWALNGAEAPLSELWFSHRQEYAARAFVVNYLSEERDNFLEEFWDIFDKGLNVHVDWEVRLREKGYQRGPDGTFFFPRDRKIDLVTDEEAIYEVKIWENGKNVLDVETQLAEYEMIWAEDWGVIWEFGTDLTDWADGFTATRFTGWLGLWGKETADVIVWGDAPGHVYFAEEKDVGDDARAKIKAKKKGGKGGIGGKGGKGGRPPRVR
jgi:hypothetical protein